MPVSTSDKEGSCNLPTTRVLTLEGGFYYRWRGKKIGIMLTFTLIRNFDRKARTHMLRRMPNYVNLANTYGFQ
jgi:hypothetical protein